MIQSHLCLPSYTISKRKLLYNIQMPRKVSPIRNKDLLLEAIAATECMQDCLIYLGLRAAGGNYATLRTVCAEYDIPVPRASGELHTRNARKSKTIPLEDILVENSSYTNRYRIKKRLYEEGILKEQCCICGLGPFWNGKPITLQLDHINGIFNDHRISNLRILCPNCHTQTNTFGSKNLKTK